MLDHQVAIRTMGDSGVFLFFFFLRLDNGERERVLGFIMIYLKTIATWEKQERMKPFGGQCGDNFNVYP